MRCLDNIRLDHQIVIEKVSGIRVVGKNATNLRGRHDDDIRARVLQKRFDLRLTFEISRFASGCDDLVVFRGEATYDGPVLWVGGADSDYITDESAVEMDRRFPRNRRVLVKGAGHWVHSEQPQVFLEVMRRFLP